MKTPTIQRYTWVDPKTDAKWRAFYFNQTSTCTFALIKKIANTLLREGAVDDIEVSLEDGVITVFIRHPREQLQTRALGKWADQTEGTLKAMISAYYQGRHHDAKKHAGELRDQDFRPRHHRTPATSRTTRSRRRRTTRV